MPWLPDVVDKVSRRYLAIYRLWKMRPSPLPSFRADGLRRDLAIAAKTWIWLILSTPRLMQPEFRIVGHRSPDGELVALWNRYNRESSSFEGCVDSDQRYRHALLPRSKQRLPIRHKASSRVNSELSTLMETAGLSLVLPLSSVITLRSSKYRWGRWWCSKASTPHNW